jgi:DNA-binding NarL/FixJ family response regulator
MKEKCVVLLVKDDPRIFNTCRKTLEHAGVKVLTIDMLAKVVEHLTDVTVEVPATSGVLTPKEVMVAKLVVAGFKNKDVAERLCLSESHIKTYLTRIYRKLGISKDRRKKLAAVLNRDQ